MHASDATSVFNRLDNVLCDFLDLLEHGTSQSTDVTFHTDTMYQRTCEYTYRRDFHGDGTA